MLRLPHTMIVGGTRGIGRAVVRQFAGLGHRVSVIGRCTPKEARLRKVTVWPCDLQQAKALNATLQQAVKKYGPLTNMIFLQRFRGEGDAWEGELAVSLTATKTLIEQGSDKFARRGSQAIGSIVIVSSNASRLVAGEQPVSYHAAKAALRQMARYYACTLAGKKIRVNCVTPGVVLKEEARGYYRTNKKLHDLYRQITPLGRMGVAEDIANAIAFLCSPQASFITGQEIVVDGGLSLLWQASLGCRVAGVGGK